MKTYKVTLISESPILLNNDQTADPLNYLTKAMKKISGKSKKTDADYLELSKLEWFGGLYFEDKYDLSAKLANLVVISDSGEKVKAQIKALKKMLAVKHRRIVIPPRLIKANLIEGAKAFRKGSAVAKANPLILDVNGLNIPPRLRFVDEDLTANELWNKSEYINPDLGADTDDESNLFYPYRDRRTVVVGRNKVIRTRFICSAWSLEYLLKISEEDFNQSEIESFLEKAGQNAGIGDYRTEYGKFSHTLEEVL